MMGVKVRGVKGLKKSIKTTISAVDSGTTKAVRDVIDRGARAVAANAPVDSGDLRSSVRATPEGVFVGERYASIVERRQPFVQPVADDMARWLVAETEAQVRKELP
jgi:predicted deacylase